MPSQPSRTIIFIILAVLAGMFIYRTLDLSKGSSEAIFQAHKHYLAAVQASPIVQRSKDLNEALSLYAQLEEQYNPFHGNGKLYHNIAEIYFQLEQYPWAAFYFYQAKALMPRSQKTEQHLERTLHKLNMSSHSKDSIFKRVFFFHYYLSLPERLQILSICTLMLFILSSIYIWKGYSFLKGMGATLLLIWTLFFSSVVYTKYFAPLEGVLVEASMLYSGTNRQSSIIVSKPIMEGSKVEVLDVLDEGKWLKIRVDEEGLGFIPSPSVRLLKT